MNRFGKLLMVPVLGLALAGDLVVANQKAPAPVELTAQGKKHLDAYEAMFEAVKAEVARSLPKVDLRLQKTLDEATEAVMAAKAKVEEANKKLGKIGQARALIDHAKGKWIGGAEKGIAQAQADLKKAKTDAERETAKKNLANWEQNKKDGLEALAEREANYSKVVKNEAQFKKELEAAKAALTKAQAEEAQASTKLLGSLAGVLQSEVVDATLAKGAVLASATPAGLAAFAQGDPEKAALVDQLLENPDLMKEMLAAGGAAYGQWGQAMEIYAGIRKASQRSGDGHFHRLAMATSLEHARPIKQSRPADESDQPSINIDPVKRYLHYEKAFLDGELDPAFQTYTTWEYRHVVNCDASDEILQWGRTMLRNYRPDHIYNPDYGWRYVSSVRTEVPYGSQNVKLDLPSLQQYQNIICNGGVCGRRAFYGRFILRAFGIPTWGVTQHKHAALSHWTPKGWVVNLGAGYGSSWWDKDEVPMSGNHFLLETQARAHGKGYAPVLRAQWISKILGETAYNDRRKVTGDFWSRAALYQQRILASTSVSLGPLGQELSEANEKNQKITSAAVSADDRKVVEKEGSIVVPAVAYGKSSGKGATMKSFGEGMQLHALGGFKTSYEVSVPRAGNYQVFAKVATVQTGQVMMFAANGKTASEVDVPYTIGMWESTTPVTLELKQGRNVIDFELKQGSRGVTIKEFLLKPVR